MYYHAGYPVGFSVRTPQQIPDTTVIVEPTTEPVSLAEFKTHIRYTESDLDSYLTGLLKSGRQFVEKYTGLALVSQILEMYLADYPLSGFIALRAPLISVVTFEAYNGTIYETVDADEYVLDSLGRFPRLLPASGVSWPVTNAVSNTLRVRWRAGYMDTSASPTQTTALIPEPLRIAVMLHAESIHTRDERMMDKLLEVAKNLCQPYAVDYGIA